MRTLRALFFAFATLFAGTCLAQGETKVARVSVTITADPSPWDKEVESGLWHLEREAPGGKWEMVMAVVGKTAHFTIKIPCEDGRSKVYVWERKGELKVKKARGINCLGRKDFMDIADLWEWIDPLPKEVQRVLSAREVSAKR